MLFGQDSDLMILGHMLHSLFGIYTVFILLATYQKLKQHEVLELLPSIAWYTLMLFPFWLQAHSFVETGKTAQTLAILLIGICLLASDYYANYFKNKVIISSENHNFIAKISVLTLSIMLIFWLLHLLSMPSIPYFQELLGETDDLKLAISRENASKLLNVPLWFIYICQVTSTISPIFLIILLQRKKWLLGGFFILCVYIYTHATLAKGPYMIFIFLMLVLGFKFLPNLYKKIVLTAGICIGVMAVAWTLYIATTNHELSPFLYEHKDEQTLTYLQEFEQSQDLSFTYGDNFRLLSNRPYYFDLQKYIQFPIFLVYRMILVPVEVSHRWYVYYPTRNQGYLGFEGLTPKTRNRPGFQHSSNVVGRWAFQQRFPKQYLDSVHAYASADADAHARWGIYGILFLCVALIGIRWFIAWLNNGAEILSLFYYTSLAVVAINLPAASLQAILAAQGLFTLVALMCIIYFILSWKTKRSLNTASQ
jgi:hypothetical protein